MPIVPAFPAPSLLPFWPVIQSRLARHTHLSCLFSVLQSVPVPCPFSISHALGSFRETGAWGMMCPHNRLRPGLHDGNHAVLSADNVGPSHSCRGSPSSLQSLPVLSTAKSTFLLCNWWLCVDEVRRLQLYPFLINSHLLATTPTNDSSLNHHPFGDFQVIIF